MRELVLDTETTGLDPGSGHRLVEIGVVEMVHGIRTGEQFHTYLNPERSVPVEVVAVHGLDDGFLADKPVFAAVVEGFLQFLAKDRLVIHNADFDLKFLNAELALLGHPPLSNPITDTVRLARAQFGSAPANLDALCRRFGVDNRNRDKHGALLDAQLLSEVYTHLQGGPQVTLNLAVGAGMAGGQAGQDTIPLAELANKPLRQTLTRPANDQELAAHQQLCAKLKNPLWDSL
ncbi:MAG: DNA polymerase III subunit epsilon [Alphaproteobacteria bacterium]|nr:DNA polymerase III subunit epsilon [Alphaproteobacteria bacterium]